LGAGLALVEMKVLLGLVARQYSLTCDNNTEWVQSIGRVPKVRVPLQSLLLCIVS
jgi:cytochrome P450